MLFVLLKDGEGLMEHQARCFYLGRSLASLVIPILLWQFSDIEYLVLFGRTDSFSSWRILFFSTSFQRFAQ